MKLHGMLLLVLMWMNGVSALKVRWVRFHCHVHVHQRWLFLSCKCNARSTFIGTLLCAPKAVGLCTLTHIPSDGPLDQHIMGCNVGQWIKSSWSWMTRAYLR